MLNVGRPSSSSVWVRYQWRNVVELARTPVFDRLWEEFPHTQLTASGRAVGLPEDVGEFSAPALTDLDGARVLDLYAGVWDGEALGDHDFVVCADEKTSIQARQRSRFWVLRRAPSLARSSAGRDSAVSFSMKSGATAKALDARPMTQMLTSSARNVRSRQ
mgnify:CR=1 FL=1